MFLKEDSKVTCIQIYSLLLIQIAQSTLEVHYHLHKYFTYIVFHAVRRNCLCLFLISKTCSSESWTVKWKTKTEGGVVNCWNSFLGIRWGTRLQFLSLAISKMEMKIPISLLPHLSTWSALSSQYKYSTSIFEYQYYFNSKVK